MLEVELNYLDPRNFDNIQELFMKLKSLLLHLKGYGIKKSHSTQSVNPLFLSKTWFRLCCFRLIVSYK
jgi:hypothetical protein